jgi:tRNA(Ile)-lysidine synthase
VLNPALIYPDRRALVAVSGGADSVALLHLLHRKRPSGLAICHVDHQLRPSSADDAAFVAKLARSLALPHFITQIDVPALATSRKISLEHAARLARHQAFSTAAQAHRTTRIFLAHHADDQAETLLMRLVRGSSPDGLAAMRPLTRLTPEGARHPLFLLRPLLHIRRSALAQFLLDHDLPHVTDPSNSSHDFLRNRVRLHALPALAAAFGRDPAPPIARAASLLLDDHNLLHQLATELLRRAAAPSTLLAAPSLDTATLLSAHPALVRRALHLWLSEHRIPDLSYLLIESIRSLLPPGAKPARTNLPAGRRARRSRSRLHLDFQSLQSPPPSRP